MADSYIKAYHTEIDGGIVTRHWQCCTGDPSPTKLSWWQHMALQTCIRQFQAHAWLGLGLGQHPRKHTNCGKQQAGRANQAHLLHHCAGRGILTAGTRSKQAATAATCSVLL